MVAFKNNIFVMKIRNEIIRATYEFFNENGFTKIDPPILTKVLQKEQVNCSILSTLMKMHSFLKVVNYIWKQCNGSWSCILIRTNFQSEKSKTRRHLIEFWMIEPEMAFTNHVESLEVQEQYVSHVVKSVLKIVN